MDIIAKLFGSPQRNFNDLVEELQEGANHISEATDNTHKSKESNSDEVKFIKSLFKSDEVATCLLLLLTANTSQFKTPYKDNIDSKSVFTQTDNRVPKSPIFTTPEKYSSHKNEMVTQEGVKYDLNIKSEATDKDTNSVFTQTDYCAPETTILKTPGKYSSHEKKKVTPVRKRCQDVVSPVAAYIRKCPTPTLYRNVRPTKPIVGTSSNPELVKSIPKSNVNNKENLTLPFVAYRTAKETKMIEVPDQQRLPKSKWAEQVASSIPKAFVIKHSRPQGSRTKQQQPFRIQQEDSFNDLSLQQADISVCTKMSAFKNLENQ